ncbi:hypothetical protein FAGAP_2244 [Fusarium agapanthi]|uniref:Uncharacterized protein n=1 Tax=Fusarium agapanthi TaxID=1803897 RepID=A0A9P5BH10_9HYPO|nr:hypothetical protein FAGAP_2244 [Fusarium agapanthi]
MARRAKIPDAQGPDAWDPSCRYTYWEEKAGNRTLHTSLLTSPSSTTVTYRAESASLLDLLPGKLQLQDSSASRRAWTVPIFGQGSPHRRANPDMFESNDYLRFDLEHPKQTACVRVSVENDLANTGTAFKFTCVEFQGSAAAKKYVANVKLKGLELSTTADDSLTSKMSWCLRIQQHEMMQKGGYDIAASMKKGREHFGAMGRTDPKQKQNDNTRQWNRQGP